MSMMRDSQGGIRTWVKTVMGGLIGIFGGVAMTWATFVVDKVIKPARPVPNYSTEVNGLAVTFQNLSQGGTEATWDFGDGTPLEFLPGDHKSVTHTYKKPGNYTVKLSLSNSFDEEQVRSVTLEVSGAQAATAGSPPALLDLKAQAPGTPGQPVYAPATFQFEAAVQNAQFLVWDFGDGRGMIPGESKAVRTFDRPGEYAVKVCVFNGKEKSEKEIRLAVLEPPRNTVSIELQVTESGTKTTQRQESATQRKQITKQTSSGMIERQIQAKPGFQIVRVEHRKSNSQNVKEIKWEIAPQKGALRVYGQMDGKPGEAATLAEHFVIVEEKKGDAVQTQTKLVGVVPAPGQIALPLPELAPNMANLQRKLGAAVRCQEKLVWQGPQLPQAVPITVGGRQFTMSAVQKGNQVEVRIQ